MCSRSNTLSNGNFLCGQESLRFVSSTLLVFFCRQPVSKMHQLLVASERQKKPPVHSSRPGLPTKTIYSRKKCCLLLLGLHSRWNIGKWSFILIYLKKQSHFSGREDRALFMLFCFHFAVRSPSWKKKLVLLA